MLCFTAAIFSACICFVAETSLFTRDYTSYENCPQVFAVADPKYDRGYFEGFDELMAETCDIRFTDVTLIDGNLFCRGEKLKSYVTYLYHISDIDVFLHDMKIIDGEPQKAPAKGEIWISSVCADSYGIIVGDILTTEEDGGKALKVSAIVATPLCPSPYMGTLPFYVSDETAESIGGTMLSGITFFTGNPSLSNEAYRKLLPDEFKEKAGSMVDAEGVRLSIAYLSDIFGGIGILASVIIFAVSLIIIKFIITSTLAKEYRAIGTYKALGFTAAQITGFYLKSFLFSGSIGVIVGVWLSFPLAQYLCNSVLRHLGKFKLTEISAILSGSSAVLLIILLAAGILLSLSKIRKITPVEAFGIENTSTKKKISRSLIKNAFSPLSMAINDIFRKKGASLLTVTVLTVSFYMSLLFSSVSYSVENLEANKSRWFAFPKYDAIITLTGEDFDSYLNGSDMVKSYVYCNSGIRMAGLETKSDVDVNDVYITIYSDCSQEALQIPLIDGRFPAADDEIIISYDMLKKAGLEIGDRFGLKNGKYNCLYLVTGTYSSMFNGGMGITMSGDEYEKFGTGSTFEQAFVTLNDGYLYENFEKDFKRNFKNGCVDSKPSFMDGSINSLNSVSKPLTRMFVIIFAMFSILNVVNLLMMNNLENRRQYGILKAMGFTNGYICLRSLLRIAIMTAFSAVAALTLHLTCSQLFFFGIIHVEGLIYNNTITCAVTAILSALIILITTAFFVPMRKIMPTDLMEE